MLLGEIDEGEDHLRQALSMNVHARETDWELAIELEKKIANILVIKGRVAEANEIKRRIATLEETMNDED